MKIFINKTLFVFVGIFILFHLTIGAKIKEMEAKLEHIKSKENVEIIKDKIRNELKSAVEKEKYLSDSDALLINKFISKLRKELSN